jgi:hypothetical protein
MKDKNMDRTKTDYYGVKGWLLLLCVTFTILDPLTGFLTLMGVTNLLKPHFNEDPGLLKIILIGGICSTCLIVYSMYAGVSLWKLAPNALITAKRYLRLLFYYSFFAIFLPSLVGLTEKTQTEFYKMNPLNNIIVMVYAGMWYLYLMKSRRVKATYGDGGSVEP